VVQRDADEHVWWHELVEPVLEVDLDQILPVSICSAESLESWGAGGVASSGVPHELVLAAADVLWGLSERDDIDSPLLGVGLS